jgi:hypothetical protein
MLVFYNLSEEEKEQVEEEGKKKKVGSCQIFCWGNNNLFFNSIDYFNMV